MKKRLLTVLLAVSLVATSLIGCGGKEDDKEDKNVESVEDDEAEADDEEEAEDKEETAGNELEEKTEEPSEDGMIEVEGEVTVIEPEEEEETPAEPEEEEDTPAVESEWANAYEDYFSREGIIPENMMMTMSVEESGIVMNIAVATAGEDVYMSYDFGTAALDLYIVENVIYSCTKMDGVESWIYAPASEGSESMFTMTDTGFADTENATACTYREEVVENDIVYDVLDVVIEEEGVTSNAAYYVNRETQKIEKCVVEQDGVEAECFFIEIEGITLPEESANAVEGTEDDIMGALIGVMFMGMGAAEY